MILADKIIDLRKKNGWSQEELAEKLDVSRQSISKWEGAQSIPDMNRILRLSEVFGVSTDYLLRDDLEPEDVRAADGGETPVVDTDMPLRAVSMEEANAFLAHRDRLSRWVSLGVMLCILSPIALILLASAQGNGWLVMTENRAAGLGLVPLILLVGSAVALFVLSALRNKPYEYLEKEWIETAYGVDGVVREQQSRFRGTYVRLLTTGIVLCVLAVLPLFVTMLWAEEDTPAGDFLYVAAVAVLLLLVSIGVLLIVRVSILWDGYRMLLEEEEYSRENKEENKKNETLVTIYWGAVTACYLAYSFITGAWDRSWIIWPVAGVSFAIVLSIAKILRRR